MATGKKILLPFVLNFTAASINPSVLLAFLDLNWFDLFPGVELALYQNKKINPLWANNPINFHQNCLSEGSAM